MGVVVLHKKSFEPLKPIVATKPRPRQVPEAFAGLRHPSHEYGKTTGRSKGFDF